MKSIDCSDRRLAFPALQKAGDNTYIPADADGNTGGEPTAISAAAKSKGAGLTGWTTSIAAGDVLGSRVGSASNRTRATMVLTVAVS